MTAIFIACGALLIDSVIGDPKSKMHPVVLIGNLIGRLEKALRRETQSAAAQIAAGGLLAALVLCAVYFAADWIVRFALHYGDLSYGAVSALLLAFTISPRALAEAGIEIRDHLQSGDLANARKKVGWIVGRDTERLDEPELARATVETIAENIVDGIISPLFYFFIGGAPLAALYRAVNTMDSMLGYKNERYLYFGRAAARTDDVFNYIPARVTALVLIAAAFLLRADYQRSARVVLRDAKKHPSPNSGYAESAVAGALGVRLGGLNYYFGVASMRAYMGDPNRALAPGHITKTIHLMYAATVLFLAAAALIAGGVNSCMIF